MKVGGPGIEEGTIQYSTFKPPSTGSFLDLLVYGYLKWTLFKFSGPYTLTRDGSHQESSVITFVFRCVSVKNRLLKY